MRGLHHRTEEGIMRDFERAVRALNITVVQINVFDPKTYRMRLVDLRDPDA